MTFKRIECKAPLYLQAANVTPEKGSAVFEIIASNEAQAHVAALGLNAELNNVFGNDGPFTVKEHGPLIAITYQSSERGGWERPWPV